MNPTEKKNRYLGCLTGLAVGDALGTTLEFKSPGSFEPINDMIGGGPFELEAGEWTDDTSMALCLAASLVERSGFDPMDQLERYCSWFGDGYMSSTGICFDIGSTVSSALTSYRMNPRPNPGSTDKYSAGNGSIMRLAPIPMFFGSDAKLAIEFSAKSSLTTHGATTAVDACRYFGGLIWAALTGVPKDVLLSSMYSPLGEGWTTQPLCTDIAEIADGSFRSKQPPEIRGTGYVVDSLEAALWAFHSSEDFSSGSLLAVNLGNDADTTGAVYGQIAGAYYGYDCIPKHWRMKLKYRDLISDYALKLMREGGASTGL